jgi:hypothetical protein
MILSFFRFPKDPYIRQKWIEACGLHDKDVSHLHICSNHFELSENLLAWKRLLFEAIPTVEKAVPNHPVELSNVNKYYKCIKIKRNVTFPTILYIMDHNNVVQSILKVGIPDHSCKLNINYIERMKICIYAYLWIVRGNNIFLC